MAADFVFSVVYCCVCGILLVPMAFIILKSIKKRENSRDFYTISTFLFLILMLIMRASTIIPITIEDQQFNNHDTYCEECIFVAAPMIMFSMALFVHTFRWYNLRTKLRNEESSIVHWNVFMITIVAINLLIIPAGVSLYCFENKLETLQLIFNYFILFNHGVLHIFLVSFNVFLIYKFNKTLKAMYPILFSKIKCKLNFFFIFIILLLLIRFGALIPIGIMYQRDSELVIPVIYTIIFGITEIFPVLLLMFSFIYFGTSSRDKIEDLSEGAQNYSQSIDSLRDTDANHLAQIDYYKHIQDTFITNSEHDEENVEASIASSQGSLRRSKTNNDKANQNNTIVYPEEIEEIQKKRFETEINERGERENTVLEESKQVEITEKDINIGTREGNLHIALKQMMSDMGMEKSSFFNCSALEDSATMSFVEDSKFDD